MSRSKKLAALLAAVVAVSVTTGASAFADSRHRNATRGRQFEGDDLRGTIERIDYRRGSLVLQDDDSGRFVTVRVRGNDGRFDDLRRGDFVELSGRWNQNGVFDAYSVNEGSDNHFDRRGRHGRRHDEGDDDDDNDDHDDGD